MTIISKERVYPDNDRGSSYCGAATSKIRFLIGQCRQLVICGEEVSVQRSRVQKLKSQISKYGGGRKKLQVVMPLQHILVIIHVHSLIYRSSVCRAAFDECHRVTAPKYSKYINDKYAYAPWSANDLEA